MHCNKGYVNMVSFCQNTFLYRVNDFSVLNFCTLRRGSKTGTNFFFLHACVNRKFILTEY